MHIVTQGIVLREVAYKESDKILTVLARGQGKVTVKSRGCRRKNSPLAAGSQLLVYSEMTWYEFQGRWALQEAATLEEFRGVREDLTALALGSYFAEVCEAVAPEGEDDPALLSLLLNCLYALETLKKPPELVRSVFDWKCMDIAGYAPLLDACAACGKEPREPRLNLREGVVTCAGCGEGAALTPEMLAAARRIVGGDPKRLFSFSLPAGQVGRFAAAASAYLSAQLERGFRTLDFYLGVKE